MLHPKVEQLLENQYVPDAPSVWDVPVEVVRQGVIAMTEGLPTPEVTVAQARDTRIPGPAGDIPVRIYTPPGDEERPLLVFFHGSGFVMCNLDTHDHTCRYLCRHGGAVVVSVDYRLAPEHAFPAAVEDSLAAVAWAAAHAADIGASSRQIAVAGDSAGGNLAAVCAQQLRGSSVTVSGQLLIYPVLDYHTPGTPSYTANDVRYGLTRERMEWFFHHYLPDPAAADDVRVAPLRAASLAGLPPAMIITAEYDVLRDEGERYAEKLQAAGVPVALRRYDGMIHGFCGYAGVLDEAEVALDECCTWLRTLP